MARLTDEVLEATARRLRHLAGVDDRFCPDMIYVANRLKQLGLIVAFVQSPDESMERDEAVYNGETRKLYVKNRVFDALDAPGNASKVERRRARFTLAHEFCHVLQPSVGTRFRGASGQLAQRLDISTRLDEIEANRFASAFLIPDHLANGALAAEQLAELFDVNIQVAILRKTQLERLQRRANNELRPLPSGVVNFLQEGKKKGYPVPSLDREIERRRKEARARGFEDVRCGTCGEFLLKPLGAVLKCSGCGGAQPR